MEATQRETRISEALIEALQRHEWLLCTPENLERMRVLAEQLLRSRELVEQSVELSHDEDFSHFIYRVDGVKFELQNTSYSQKED